MFILDTDSYIFTIESRNLKKDLQDKIFQNLLIFQPLTKKTNYMMIVENRNWDSGK